MINQLNEPKLITDKDYVLIAKVRVDEQDKVFKVP